PSISVPFPYTTLFRSEPAFKDARVDRAEVDGVNEVARVEFGERGVLAQKAGADHRAEDEHRAGGAVVGALRGVLADTTAELTERDRKSTRLNSSHVKS